MNVKNIFGELLTSHVFSGLINKLHKFSFDSSSQLRVGGSVSVSSGTITTVTTVTTANMSFGDMGKPSSAQIISANTFYGSVGKNFIRN